MANLFNPVLMSAALENRPMALGTTYVLGPVLGILFSVFFEWDDSRTDGEKTRN